MALLYAFDKAGGFLAGDTATGRTAYAYPTSPHATTARRRPSAVAQQMIDDINAFPYGTGALADRLNEQDRRKMAELATLTRQVA